MESRGGCAPLRAATLLLTLLTLLALLLPAARASALGSIVQGADPAGDVAAGEAAADLRGHLWNARNWDSSDPAVAGIELSVRQQGAGWLDTVTFVDADRDGTADLRITAAGSGNGNVFVQFSRPVAVNSSGCYQPGINNAMTAYADVVSQTISGSDRRISVHLPRALFNDAALDSLQDSWAAAPRVVTVGGELPPDGSGAARDWVPNSAGGDPADCGSFMLARMDDGADRGQVDGTAGVQHLIDGAGDNGAAGDADLAGADISVWQGAQPVVDPTAVGNADTSTVATYPADATITLAAAAGAASPRATLAMYGYWYDSGSPTAPIGAIQIRPLSATRVLVDYFRTTSGTALASGTGCALAPSAGDRIRTAVLAVRGGTTIEIPLDPALGTFDGVNESSSDAGPFAWRYALWGAGDTPDYVPDTIGEGLGTGAACSGVRVNTAELPLARRVGPKAALSVSPTTVPRTTQATLNAGASTGTSTGRRYRFAAAGAAFSAIGSTSTATFTPAANATTGSRVGRVLVRDDDGAVDMASATYSVANALPTATVSGLDGLTVPTDGSPAELVLPAGGAPTTFRLAATNGSDPEGKALTYAWTLRKANDPATVSSGSGSTFTTPPFTRGQAQRIYSLQLQVTDADGGSQQVYATLKLVDGPEATIVSSSPSVVYPGTNVTLIAKTSGIGERSPFQYAWNTGSGWSSYSGQASVTVSYPASGTKNVRVRVRDAGGAVAESADYPVIVTPPGQVPPTAVLAATVGGQAAPPAQPRSADDVVRFDAAGSRLNGPDAAPTEYRFDFGDGSTKVSATPVVEHTYAGSGPYRATVVIRDTRSGAVNDSPAAAVNLTVRAGSSDANAPRGAIVRTAPASGPIFATRPVTLAVDGLVLAGAGAATYAWDLDGDGSFETDTASTPQVMTSYDDAGARSVRVRVTDAQGRRAVLGPLRLDVRAAPSKVPTVVLKAPASVRLDGSGVDVALDATGSTGNEDDPTLSYAFDLDGDGTYETATGTNPKATARLGRRGAVTLGVRVTDPYGLTAEARREVLVRTAEDEVPGCAGNAIVRTIALGPIKARACFARIDRGSAGPLWIAFGDAELNGIRITGASGSTRTEREFPDCSTEACQAAERAFNAKDSTASIALDTAAAKLWSSRPLALKLEGQDVELPLGLAPLDIDLPFGKTSDGFLIKVGPSTTLLGLPVEGEAEVRFPAEGRTTVRVQVGLSFLTDGLTTGVTVEAVQGEGTRLDDLNFALSTTMLGTVIKLKKLAFHYNRTARLFEGAAAMTLPFERPFDIAIALRVKDNRLLSIYGEATGLNRHLGKGVFLQGVRAGYGDDPKRLLGGIQLSAGPRVKLPWKKADDPGMAILLVDGNFGMQLPLDGKPAIFGLSGKATLGGVLPLAESQVLVSQNGLVAARGQVGGDYSVGYFQVTIDGWIAERAFNAEGDASIGLIIAKKRVELAGGTAVVSSTGWAACGRIPVINVGGGLGQRWGESLATFDGCDLGEYRTARPADLPSSLDDIVRPGDLAALQRAAVLGVAPTSALLRPLSGRRARQASRGERIVVPRGAEQVSLQLEGEAGVPEAKIVTAGGQVLVDTATGDQLEASHLVLHDAPARRTSVLLKDPPAGDLYVVEAASAPVARVRSAFAQTRQRVRARVVRRGDRQLVRWSVRPALRPGQVLELSERVDGPAGAEAEGGSPIVQTTRSSGEQAFTPLRSAERGRSILAGVRTNGLVREVTTVARYRTPAVRPPAPTAVRLLRRDRTVRVRWSGARPSAGWTVVLRASTGQALTLSGSSRSARLADVPLAAAVKATVTARDQTGAVSAARPVSLGAGERDSARRSSPSDAAPRALRIARKGAVVTVRWRGGQRPVRSWTVRLQPAKGGAVTLIRPATGRSAVFNGIARGRVRVTITGRTLSGQLVRASARR